MGGFSFLYSIYHKNYGLLTQIAKIQNPTVFIDLDSIGSQCKGDDRLCVEQKRIKIE